MTAPVVDPGEAYYREHDVTLHQGHVLPQYCGLIVDRIGQPIFDFGEPA